MDINQRIEETQNELNELEQVLLFINEVQDEQPKVVLQNSRIAAEHLSKGVLKFHNQETLKTTLDPLIVAVSKIDKIPKHIIVSLRTIQHYGNLGSHHNNEDKFDISPCLQALVNVINWYFSDLHNINIKAANVIDLNKKMQKMELEKQNKLERLSFCLSLDTDDKTIIDTTHDYLSITRFDVLNSDSSNYTSHRWLNIKNKSNSISEYIMHQESGENKISFEQFNIKAFEESRSGQELVVENLIKLQPSFVQKAKIHFNKPLKYLDEYKLYYRISWPGELLSYSGEIHTQSISFTRIMGKIGKVKFGIFDTLDLTPIKCMGITENYEEINLNLDPVVFSAEDIEEFKPIHNKGYKGFYYELNNINIIAVRIYYNAKKVLSTMNEEF